MIDALSSKWLNTSIKYANENPVIMSYPKFDISTLRTVGYSHVTFADNKDLTSRLDRIVLLAGTNGNAAPILFKSYKSRRVTRSVLAAEVIAIADLFDEAFTLRAHLEQALKRPMSIHSLTDSKSLFDIIGRALA